MQWLASLAVIAALLVGWLWQRERGKRADLQRALDLQALSLERAETEATELRKLVEEREAQIRELEKQLPPRDRFDHYFGVSATAGHPYR